MTSVACEKGFNLQNKIKVKAWTTLTPKSLDTLKLAVGPEVEEFPYERAIRHWNQQKKHPLARLIQPKKPAETNSDSLDSPIVI